MTTIQPLGNHGMAGSKEHPTTYKIRACPRCYAVLYWSEKGQTQITCDNCNTQINMLHYTGPVAYAQEHIRTALFTMKTLTLILWVVLLTIDYRLRLNKLLSFLYLRIVSHL